MINQPTDLENSHTKFRIKATLEQKNRNLKRKKLYCARLYFRGTRKIFEIKLKIKIRLRKELMMPFLRVAQSPKDLFPVKVDLIVYIAFLMIEC